jgi:hypothetical protein
MILDGVTMRIHLLSLACIFAMMTSTNAIAGNDLAKKLQPILSAESYRFSVQPGNAQPGVDVKYQKDIPLHVLADKIEFFRKDDVLVYKQGDAWQRTRRGTLSDPLRILGASAKVRDVRLPHDELAILGKSLFQVKQTDAVVMGELRADAARQLARTEDRDLARDGSAKLWFDSQGRLEKYEIAIRVQGRRGNAEVDGVVTHTVTLSALGMTKVEVPPGAKKALE